jgi:thiamine kinase-like enzyme
MLDEDKIRHLPCWNGAVDIAPLRGGMSNANYLVTDGTGKHVVRFGKDYPFHHVSREREVMVARAAHAAGFAPEVEFSAPGVMVTTYLGAKTFNAEDVRANAARVGKLIRDFHTTMPARITGAGFMFWVFHVIRDYAHTLRQSASAKVASLPQWLAEAAAYERVQKPTPIIFGHHDLLPANFLDDGSKLWLIDFEYAGFGTAMFDLAGASSNAGMTGEERALLLETYFSGKPDAEMIQAFAAMECASLLREAMWSMVSSLYLAAPGVDYEAYTAENLSRYAVARDTYQTNYGKLDL